MKSISSIIILLLTIFVAQAQDMNRTTIDTRFNREILIGFCDRIGLQQHDFGEMFKAEYKDFKPDDTIVSKLKNYKSNLSIVMVVGTWCPDCQERVPHFYKLLDEIGISDKSMKVIGVDGYKKCEGVELERYKIEKVPTFIFYRDKKEIGRIVESPKKSLEEDMLGIVS